MITRNKHCLIFLALFIILLFGASIVSASTVEKQSKNTTDVKQLSTPSNYDVDKKVQSDIGITAKSDAKAKETITTNTTNTINTINTSNSVNSEITKKSTKTLKTADDGSFTALFNKINAGGIVNLENDYEFNSQSDTAYQNGISITKNVTINGNGYSIDGKNSSRIFKVTANGVSFTLANLTIKNANPLSDTTKDGGAIFINTPLESNTTLIHNVTFSTLRINGKFASAGTPQILTPVNGEVKITLKADLYLRSAVNVTGSYGETSKYYGARSTQAGKASISKRDAQLTVTTVNNTKQDVNITLKAQITDITHGKNNGNVYDYDDNFIIFKVNGITIKDENGTAKKAQVKNGIATMQYNIPAGLAGKYTNLTDKIYTVNAIFGSEEYNSKVENTTTFTVERSPITFDYKKITLNTTSKELYIQADIKDYPNNNLKGTNTLLLNLPIL